MANTPTPTPILAMAPHPWNGHWLSRQHLLSRLGKRGWPILYSSGALSLWDRSTPQWHTAPWLGKIQVQENVQVELSGRFPPRWPRIPAWDRAALAWHARRLTRHLPGWEQGEGAMMLFHPRFWPYVEALQPRYVLYHIYDVYAVMDQWSPELARMERQLVERADRITAASEGMVQALPAPGPDKARILHNGADVELFLPPAPPCPADLAAIPTPRIGYVGRVNAKVDFAALGHVATHRPHWHWVILGEVRVDGDRPAEQEARQAWEACLRLPNVHYLGVKKREEVPAYTHHMTVNTICYRIRPDDWVVHGYPVKLHEYLATGRPVVAGAQEAVARLFSDVVAVARTPAEWETALEQAIASGGVGTPDSRRRVAMENGWERRVDQLEGWLRELTGGGGESAPQGIE